MAEEAKSQGPVKEGSLAPSKDQVSGAPEDAKSKINEPVKDDAGEAPKKKENACSKCCQKFMKVAANDALYGSFLGPHPVSFVCMCVPCRKCCNQNKLTVAPLCVASIVTKLMNLLFMSVVVILACFFITPWPDTVASTSLSVFYPCDGGKLSSMNAINGGCTTHAGHFMVYRCFLAYATAMATNAFIMTYITSTGEDINRAKIHHGFWLFKLLYLIGLLLFYFFILHGSTDPQGFFEYVTSIFGNVAHFIFSLIEVTFILDLAELWVVENRTSTNSWSNFLYNIFTCVIFFADFVSLIYIISDFAATRVFPTAASWPHSNCEIGYRYWIDWRHTILIIGMVSLFVLVFTVACFRDKFKKRFPFFGWFQVSVFIGFCVFYLWSSLYSSSHVNSRPRCNMALFVLHNRTKQLNGTLVAGVHDVYYRHTGFIHGLLIIFVLVYYTFIHGPRSKTAPFSIVFLHIWGNEGKIPVYPDPETGPEEFKDAIENMEVWDDEQEGVVYSWSKFYWLLVLAALAMMMAMTNFTNPWARDMYNSSDVALGFKYASAVAAIIAYLMLLLFPCSRIYPQYERRSVTKKLKLVVGGDDNDNILESEFVVADDDCDAPVVAKDEEVKAVTATPSVNK